LRSKTCCKYRIVVASAAEEDTRNFLDLLHYHLRATEGSDKTPEPMALVPAPPPMLFGAVFVRKSFVISSDSFARADATHWTLDLAPLLQGAYHEVRDVCLFIPNANLLDNNSALVLYVQAGNSPWEYRGCVSNVQPSEVFPLNWPLNPDGTVGPNAQIGVSVEPTAEVVGKEQQVLGSKEEFAKRVAMDLFRYMESFIGDDRLGVGNVIDNWFNKFLHKFRRDPNYLTRNKEQS